MDGRLSTALGARPHFAALALLLVAGAPASSRAQCCAPLPVSRHAWTGSSGWNLLPTWVGATDDGWVHLVHRDNRVAWLYTSSDAAMSFGFPDTLFTEGSDSDGFAIAPDGTILVGYQRDDMLWFRRSTNHAQSFSPPVALAPMQRAFVFPHPDYVTIRAAASGLTGMVATTDRTLDQGHAILASPDLGQTWSAPLLLRSRDEQAARIVATETTVAVAYEEGGQILVRRSADAGQSWTPPVRAASRPLDVTPWHALVSTGPGQLQLVYLADTGSSFPDVRVAVSLDDGATWDPVNETVVGSAWILGDAELFALATPSGAVVVGGWFDPGGAPGVASNFSTGRGLPGTWLSAPAYFAAAGRAQHDFAVAVLADDTVIVVHDDYRHAQPADCAFGGTTCESIYMSRSCPGTGVWEEFRLDEDFPPNPTHSEEPAIATTSQGRLHVVWLNAADSGLGVVQLRSMAVQPTADVPVVQTLTPAPDCQSATHELSLDTGLLDSCPGISIQWFLNGAPIPGATGPTLPLDPADVDGINTWHATLLCGAAGCEFRTLDTTPPPFDPAAPLVVRRTDFGTDGCHPARTVLEAVPIPLSECPLIAYQWYMDGGSIPGARSRVLEVSSDSFPVGTHSFHVEGRCVPSRACGGTVWPAETITVEEPDPVVPPASVGAALRVGQHGSPLAADITAVLDWSRDEGLPRTNQHYHVLRGAAPTGLVHARGWEPLGSLFVTDSTPAAASLPLVHYYSVLAANACEDVSSD